MTGLEPVVSVHGLLLDLSVIISDRATIQKCDVANRNEKSLFYQMTHICRERNALRHDDRVDVLAMLVAFFIEIMDQDANKSANIERSEALMKELQHVYDLNVANDFGSTNNCWNSTV